MCSALAAAEFQNRSRKLESGLACNTSGSAPADDQQLCLEALFKRGVAPEVLQDEAGDAQGGQVSRHRGSTPGRSTPRGRAGALGLTMREIWDAGAGFEPAAFRL